VNIEIDCTPVEARQFFGLPDVGPLQAAVMERVQKEMLAEKWIASRPRRS
jgi:Family of unknown function (DUF6489)